MHTLFFFFQGKPGKDKQAPSVFVPNIVHLYVLRSLLTIFSFTLHGQKHICIEVNIKTLVHNNNPILHRSWFNSSLAAFGLDGNGLQLEKLANFFKFLLCILEKKWLTTDYSLYFLIQIISYSPPPPPPVLQE